MKRLAIALLLVLAACGGSDTASVELVQAAAAASTIESAEVVVLDVRTPEEFEAGHIDGAVNIDFYAADFQAQLEQLDRDASYVMYCRSGNRSATTATIMRGLDFTEVDEIDGGILSWVEAGLPVATP